MFRVTTETDAGGYAAETLTHDRAGNLTYDGVLKYAYDGWNRLVKATKAYRDSGGALQSGSTVAVYTYDDVGRRISKTVEFSGGGGSDLDGTYHYYHDSGGGGSIVEVRNGSNQVIQQLVRPPGSVPGSYVDELVQVALNGDPVPPASTTYSIGPGGGGTISVPLSSLFGMSIAGTAGVSVSVNSAGQLVLQGQIGGMGGIGEYWGGGTQIVVSAIDGPSAPSGFSGTSGTIVQIHAGTGVKAGGGEVIIIPGSTSTSGGVWPMPGGGLGFFAGAGTVLQGSYATPALVPAGIQNLLFGFDCYWF